MDEIIIALRGKVDEWRIHRKGVLAAGMFDKGTRPENLYGLPFDNELDSEVDLISEYKEWQTT